MGANGYKMITVTAGPNPRTGKLSIWDGNENNQIEVNVAKRIDLRNKDLMTFY